MIKIYDKSWHILVRKKYSDLHSQKPWNGLSIVPEFEQFMQGIKDTTNNIWDIGCGFNIIKEYYPHLRITGVDKTWEADIHSHLEQSRMHLTYVQHAFAINSLHFGTVENVSERVRYVMDSLPKAGTFFLTLNNFLSEEEFAEYGDPDFWQKFGTVKNLKFISKEECDKEYHVMKDWVTEFLSHANLDGEYDISQEVESIWESAISTDSLWGRCRVLLKK